LIDVICQRVFSPTALREIVDDMKKLYLEHQQKRSRQWQESNARLIKLRQEIDNLLDVLQSVGTENTEIVDRLKEKSIEKQRLEALVATNGSKMVRDLNSLKIDTNLLSEYLINMVNKFRLNESSRIRAFFKMFIQKVLLSEVQIELFYSPEIIINTKAYIEVPSMVWKDVKWLPGTTILSSYKLIKIDIQLPRYSLTT
jgi:hypothetical protein